jgi:hypothetical protein
MVSRERPLGASARWTTQARGLEASRHRTPRLVSWQRWFLEIVRSLAGDVKGDRPTAHLTAARLGILFTAIKRRMKSGTNAIRKTTVYLIHKDEPYIFCLQPLNHLGVGVACRYLEVEGVNRPARRPYT